MDVSVRCVVDELIVLRVVSLVAHLNFKFTILPVAQISSPISHVKFFASLKQSVYHAQNIQPDHGIFMSNFYDS